MPLFKCPECGEKVSSYASACPGCGCPISRVILLGKPYLDSTDEKLPKKNWARSNHGLKSLKKIDLRPLSASDAAFVDGKKLYQKGSPAQCTYETKDKETTVTGFYKKEEITVHILKGVIMTQQVDSAFLQINGLDFRSVALLMHYLDLVKNTGDENAQLPLKIFRKKEFEASVDSLVVSSSFSSGNSYSSPGWLPEDYEDEVEDEAAEDYEETQEELQDEVDADEEGYNPEDEDPIEPDEEDMDSEVTDYDEDGVYIGYDDDNS